MDRPQLITKRETRYMGVNLDRGAGYGDTLTWTEKDKPKITLQPVEIQVDLILQKISPNVCRMMSAPTFPLPQSWKFDRSSKYVPDHFSPCLLLAGTLILLPQNSLLWSDEWKASHALVSPTGVMDLFPPATTERMFFPGPENSSDALASWLEQLQTWRVNRRIRLRYDGSQYERADLEWTQHVFSQVQLLIWDRRLYDPDKRAYTVDRFLDETESRIGPIDAVLIWHVYPNLGVDDRNQFDLLRDLPGGLPALRHMVEQFPQPRRQSFLSLPCVGHRHPRGRSTSPAIALTQLLKDIGADGINFDTLESIPADFRAPPPTQHPLAFEPQFELRDESIAWSTLGWNDWVTWEDRPYPFVPMVNKSSWLEPRHMVNVTDRFTRDKTDSLQHAFFNGDWLCHARKSLGILVWDDAA